jgi:hypothetical protein
MMKFGTVIDPGHIPHEEDAGFSAPSVIRYETDVKYHQTKVVETDVRVCKHCRCLYVE